MTVSPARRPARIRTRLVLVLAVPTLLLLAAVCAQAASRLDARSAAAVTARHARLALAVQDLAHALQHERALLTALLAGESRARTGLSPARRATGRAGAALSRLLATIPARSYGPLRDTLARLPALDRARTASPALSPAPEAPATPGAPPPRAGRGVPAPTTPQTGPYGAPIAPSGIPSLSAGGPPDGTSAGAHDGMPTGTDPRPADALAGTIPDAPSATPDPLALAEAAPHLPEGTPDGTDPLSTGDVQPLAAAGTNLRAPEDTPGGTDAHPGAPPLTPVQAPGTADEQEKLRREVFEAFTDVITRLNDGLAAEEPRDGDPSLRQRARALEAIGRAEEAAAQARAVVTAAFAAGGFTRYEYVTFLEARASMTEALAAYRRAATPEGLAALARAQRGTEVARAGRLERRALAASPGTPLAARTRAWLTADGAYVKALRDVQRSAGEDLRDHATATIDRHTGSLWWLGAAGVALLMGMVALGVFLARSVTRPIRGLAAEAAALANHLAALEAADPDTPPGPRAATLPPYETHPGTNPLRHEPGPTPYRNRPGTNAPSYGTKPGAPPCETKPGATAHPYETGPSMNAHPYGREPDASAHPGGARPGTGTPFADTREKQGRLAGALEGLHGADRGRPAGLRGTAREELARLAGTLEEVHGAAVRIAAGRAALRRDTAAALSGLGARTRDLVHRQLAFITALQRDESDPAVLTRLCELDRVTSRLRRNAESVLVLTGERAQRRSSEPVPVDEVLRSVLAEIEDHHRVALRTVGRAHVRGPVVPEVAHMLAELVENALRFSPPDAEVEVVSRAAEDECRITISDYGVGMTPGELALANARLRGERSFLVAPTHCLGHHVVGRLAERLGVRVSLHESSGCGITAVVALPEELLAVRAMEPAESTR